LSAGLMPCTLEYMDATALQVVRDRLTIPLPEKTAALLLVEFDGTAHEVEKQGERFADFVGRQENCLLRRAKNEQESDELWLARRSIAPACLSLRPHKIAEDVVVPRSRIPDLVQWTEQLARELHLIILTFGHAGDGNIHVNIMVDRQDEQEYAHGLKAKERLFKRVLALGGTLSGEHGVGMTKSPFLSQELDKTALSLMRKLKAVFDPHNILNPGKIFPD
ncbi:MAG: glycolate oxidase subunit GlcD, partial [Candidatus Electrothrix sp. EH2]|nr:glycolate oxidase subunit GlcD [Candidatus Electrothrix sp. EH2]